MKNLNAGIMAAMAFMMVAGVTFGCAIQIGQDEKGDRKSEISSLPPPSTPPGRSGG